MAFNHASGVIRPACTVHSCWHIYEDLCTRGTGGCHLVIKHEEEFIEFVSPDEIKRRVNAQVNLIYDPITDVPPEGVIKCKDENDRNKLVTEVLGTVYDGGPKFGERRKDVGVYKAIPIPRQMIIDLAMAITKDEDSTTMTMGEIGNLNNATDEYYLVLNDTIPTIPRIYDYHEFKKRFKFKADTTVKFRELLAASDEDPA